MTTMVRRPKSQPEVQRVLRAVWRATSGNPQAWRGLDRLGLSENSMGVQRAVTDGLLLIEGGHSVCLTDDGRRLVEQVLSAARHRGMTLRMQKIFNLMQGDRADITSNTYWDWLINQVGGMMQGIKEDQRLKGQLDLDRIRGGLNRMIEEQLRERGRRP